MIILTILFQNFQDSDCDEAVTIDFLNGDLDELPGPESDHDFNCASDTDDQASRESTAAAGDTNSTFSNWNTASAPNPSNVSKKNTKSVV